jgi:hypothetical protein
VSQSCLGSSAFDRRGVDADWRILTTEEHYADEPILLGSFEGQDRAFAVQRSRIPSSRDRMPDALDVRLRAMGRRLGEPRKREPGAGGDQHGWARHTQGRHAGQGEELPFAALGPAQEMRRRAGDHRERQAQVSEREETHVQSAFATEQSGWCGDRDQREGADERRSQEMCPGPEVHFRALVRSWRQAQE